MGETVPEKAKAAIRHGGNLGRARLLFPEAPEPWIDLSTGINPHSYPHSPVPASAFARLPEPDAAEELRHLAATHFGAPSARHVAPSPGTQMLMPLLAQIAIAHGARSGAVLSPAYAEHARTARMAGLAVTEVENIDAMSAHDYAVVVNPNNPDGRITDRAALLSLAEAMRRKGGLLVVDEAFIETEVPKASQMPPVRMRWWSCAPSASFTAWRAFGWVSRLRSPISLLNWRQGSAPGPFPARRCISRCRLWRMGNGNRPCVGTLPKTPGA
jgi:histidinol-phosphate/aromatic aminotransferase/cobyric acid decarboxylase-like protein